MKTKKIIFIVVFVLLLFLGMTFGTIKLMHSLKNEKQKMKENKEEITIMYAKLNEKASSFNQKKEEYDYLMSTLYYTNVQEKNGAILKILNEYDAIIKEIMEIGNTLEDKCSISYAENEFVQKCNSYKISYESAMQIFKSDIKRYNTLVDNYNVWTEQNSKYKKIDKFVSKYVK